MSRIRNPQLEAAEGRSSTLNIFRLIERSETEATRRSDDPGGSAATKASGGMKRSAVALSEDTELRAGGEARGPRRDSL